MTTETVIFDPAEGVASLGDVRPGDHADVEVLMSGGWRRMRDCDVWRSDRGDLMVGLTVVRYADGKPSQGVRVLRVWREVPPMLPLPTTPGDVILATVHGVEGVRLFLAPDDEEDAIPWFSAVLVDGRRWHGPEDITAWEPISVQEATR